MEERLTTNQEVVGSTPIQPVIFYFYVFQEVTFYLLFIIYFTERKEICSILNFNVKPK